MRYPICISKGGTLHSPRTCRCIVCGRSGQHGYFGDKTTESAGCAPLTQRADRPQHRRNVRSRRGERAIDQESRDHPSASGSYYAQHWRTCRTFGQRCICIRRHFHRAAQSRRNLVFGRWALCLVQQRGSIARSHSGIWQWPCVFLCDLRSNDHGGAIRRA